MISRGIETNNENMISIIKGTPKESNIGSINVPSACANGYNASAIFPPLVAIASKDCSRLVIRFNNPKSNNEPTNIIPDMTRVVMLRILVIIFIIALT